MIKLEIDKSHQIIRKVYTAELTCNVILEGVEEIAKISEKNPNLKGIQVDLRECKPLITPEDSKQLSRKVCFDSRLPEKIAFIADSPFKTALSLIFKEYANRETFEVFNTTQAAEEWLLREF